MGSFNVSCGISHTSIGCFDDAGIILLLPNQYNLMDGLDESKGAVTLHPTHLVCTNEGSFSYYQAISLPIFGKYGDYGMLEDIVKDDGVKALEAYFECDIYDILNIALDHYDKPEAIGGMSAHKLQMLQCASGMFVHKDIYEQTAIAHFEKLGNSKFDEGRLDRDNLLAMGFEQVNELSPDVEKRYKYIYMHPSSQDVCLKSDNTWSHFANANTYEDIKNCSIYRVADLAKAWYRHTKVKLDLTEFKKLSVYDGSFKDYIRAMEERRRRLEEAERQETEEMKALYKRIAVRALDSCDGSFFKQPFYDIYESIMTEQWINDAASTFKHVYWMMYCTNRLFMPTFNGPQCGEYDEERAMNRVITKVLTARRKEWGR